MSQSSSKACPVIARQSEKGLELLAFRHPYAGTQLITETVEDEEHPRDASLRALVKESGVSPKGAPLSLGTSNGIVQRESWNFILFQCPPLPDDWTHSSSEDDGNEFRFFWQPAEEYLEGDWPAPFIRALRFAASKIEKLSPKQKNQFCEVQHPEIAKLILKKITSLEEGKTLDPTDVARAIAGSDEKKWRHLMPTIRSESIKLASIGEVSVIRNGKPVSGSDFKGLYKIGKNQS